MDAISSPQTVAGLNIAVTSSATLLTVLLDTASTGSSAQLPIGADSIDLRPENGDIRVTFDPKLTPTATAGRLIRQGEIARFRRRYLKGMQLISTTSFTINVGIELGKSTEEDDETFTSSIMAFGLPKHGELVGIATATQLPSIAAKFVKFKARASNTGNVYIGTSASVTTGAGATNTTTGFELAAGDETPWLPVAGGNLNCFYRICTSTADHLTYITNND